jgi:peptidyl-tRNA hydrolase, PTH1 family
MNIVVGLGNPGEKYQRTRHNAGWLFLDFLVQQESLDGFQLEKKLHSEISKSKDLLLVKPQTFMNDSGKAVQAVLKWYGQHDNVFVIYDDLDLELGKYKIQFGSGPKIHNGLNSIREHLGTNEFWSIRIGVDGRSGDRTLPGHVYVLQTFSEEEKQIFEDTLKKINAELKSKMQRSE